MLLKYFCLVAVLVFGSVAAEDIKQQDQIYIVSGVLGGVCLLLTIAAIINAVSITRLQTKVAVLQATHTASTKTIAAAPRMQQQQVARPEEMNRFASQEDPYRAAAPRENYRMERPAPPPRPQRMGPSARDNYY